MGRQRSPKLPTPDRENALRQKMLLSPIPLPPWSRQFTPIRGRRFRCDSGWPEYKIALEVDGGTWSQSPTGHNTGAGIRAGNRKANALQLHGWIVLRFTSDMLERRSDDEAINDIIAALRLRGAIP